MLKLQVRAGELMQISVNDKDVIVYIINTLQQVYMLVDMIHKSQAQNNVKSSELSEI